MSCVYLYQSAPPKFWGSTAPLIKNAEFLVVNAGGTHINYCALSG